MKIKNSPLKRAKNKAWKYFSIYIRTRDCLRFTGDPTEGMCVTCKEWLPFNQLQAGHFVGGRTNSVLFDEEIVHTQCAYCNRTLAGNYQAYTIFMLKTHTEDEIDELLSRRFKTVKYTTKDLLDLALYYKNKTSELLDEHKKTLTESNNQSSTLGDIAVFKPSYLQPAIVG